MDNNSKVEKEIGNEGGVSVETLDLAIVEALLQGENVIIPDFGYLELKELSESRRTVLFRTVDPEDSFMRSFSEESEKEKQQSVIYKSISKPLKEGEVVSLSRLGIFRPLKKADGSIRISYTLSPAFRRQLNGEAIGEVTHVKSQEENLPGQSIYDDAEFTHNIAYDREESEKEIVEKTADKSTQDIVENVISDEEMVATNNILEKKYYSETDTTSVEKEDKINKGKERKFSKVGDVIVPQDDNDETIVPRRKSIVGPLLIVAVCLLLLIIISSFFFFNSSKNEEQQQSFVMQESESVNLPLLAEKNYGNSAFWVYIYEANKERLQSPVNIPASVNLVIPDLSEYGVDPKDSLEIRRANMLSEIILKK